MAGSTLYIWYAQQSEEMQKATFDALAATMPVSVQKELYAYKRWQDAQASLAGKLLLSKALEELKFPFTIHDISLQHKERPHIDPAFDFNISHSGNFIVLVVSKENKVGIDIEKHRELDPVLFRKYFSEEEWSAISEAEDALPEFFRFWAIRESAIKCDGRGVEVLGKTATLDEKTVRCDEAVFHYRVIEIAKNYSCAVCSKNEISEIILQEVSKLLG